MVELVLEGWTAAQREALGFLLEDGNIAAEWSATAVSVPGDSVAQVQRFINFVGTPSEHADVASHAPVLPVLDASDWDGALDDPRPIDELGISDAATPGLRLGGFLIDSLVITLLFLPAAMLGGWSGTGVQIGLIACYEIATVGLLGRTLGNMAVRTRVVRIDDGGYPGLRAALVRWFVPQVGFLIVLALSWPDAVSLLWSIAVFAPILSGPTFRGLHDRAAGVMVLDDRDTARRSHPAPSNEPRTPS
jgi:uncharacterized RDD family membrane protein YckC